MIFYLISPRAHFIKVYAAERRQRSLVWIYGSEIDPRGIGRGGAITSMRSKTMVVGFSKRFALLAVLAGAALMASPPSAHAAFTLTLHEAGFADQTITDNGAGDLSNTTSGVITFAGAFGTFDIQISVGTSNSAAGVQPAQLTINNTSITSTGGSGTLSVTLTDTGFTAPGTGSALLDTQLSTTQLPLGTTVTSHSVLNGTAGGNVQLTTVGGSLREDVATIGTNPYTLSNITTFSLAGNGTLQFTGITTVTAVPEPGTMAMTFSAISLFGLGYWRRRKLT